jgi:hypothetical protein
MYENFVVPLSRSVRKLRSRTRGILLNKMRKSMGGLRMPISIAEGNRRPHDPVQAAKFVSGGCTSQASNTNFDALETLQEAL